VGQFRAFVKAKGYLTDAENSTQGGLRFRAGKWAVDQRTNWQNPGFEQTDENPVACVSWNDAQAFCEWLSALEGRRYTLPTEAQWEYACRSGSTAKYHFGDDDGLLSEFAWYGANSGGKSHRVGTKKPNAWGLYDMHGSLWQWTMDRYAVDSYRTSPKADPQGPQTGVLRVVRGGSWFDPATLCRSAHRGYLRPSWIQTHVGFRVAVVGDLKSKPASVVTAPPPRTAARLLRRFDPVKDETIIRGQQDKSGWLFTNPPNERTARLYELADPKLDPGGVLAFRATMSTFDVSWVYPEIICRFADGTETHSVIPKVAEASTGPVIYEVRCPLKPDARPNLIRLNLVVKGREGGHAFFKQMELWQIATEQLHGRLAPPTALPRKFDPAKDESATFARPQDATGWYFDIKPNQELIRLYEVEHPATDDGATLVLRGRFGTRAVKGAYLQIVCCFPDGTETLSDVPVLIAAGDTNPSQYEVSHRLPKGARPYLVRLNLCLKKSTSKDQSVFFKELELSQLPATGDEK